MSNQAQITTNKIPITRTVLLHKKDSLLEVSILVNKQAQIKLEKTHVYAWYAFDKIQTNQGAYSGHLLHGGYKVFNQKDQLIEQGHYHHGIKEGLWSMWDTKGLKTFECNYKDGLKDGEAFYFSAGKLTIKENYKNGRLHGEVVHFLPDGKQEESKYKHGTLVDFDKEESKKDSFFIRLKNKRAVNKKERIKTKEQKKLDKEQEKMRKKDERQSKKKTDTTSESGDTDLKNEADSI
jgi:hypothetical protein